MSQNDGAVEQVREREPKLEPLYTIFSGYLHRFPVLVGGPYAATLIRMGKCECGRPACLGVVLYPLLLGVN